MKKAIILFILFLFCNVAFASEEKIQPLEPNQTNINKAIKALSNEKTVFVMCFIEEWDYKSVYTTEMLKKARYVYYKIYDNSVFVNKLYMLFSNGMKLNQDEWTFEIPEEDGIYIMIYD